MQYHNPDPFPRSVSLVADILFHQIYFLMEEALLFLKSASLALASPTRL